MPDPTVRLGGAADLPRLAAFVRAFDPEHVEVHHALLWELAPRDRPRGFTAHVLQRAQDRLRGVAEPTLSATLEARAVAEADVVSIATRAARDLLLADHPAVAARVRLVPLAPTLPRVPRAPDADAGPIVMALRFDWLKGIDLALAALPALAALRPVVIAGGAPESPRAAARWTKRLTAAGVPGLELPGWLAPEALAALLARAGVFLSPSRIETCGLAVMEAVAAGVPVVASDLEAHREVAPSATLFPCGDADALAHAVRRALSFAPDCR